MNGVLGGFKNMLRRWRINLKMKKKKVKQNKNKITKYPRLTSFIYSTIAIIYSPFGYMFAKSNKQANLEQPKLYKKIEKINLKLDEAIINENTKINIKTLTKEIEKIKEEINIPMTTESKNYFQGKINELKLKTKFIENPTKITSIEAKVISDSLEKNIKKLNKPKQINKKLLGTLPLVISKEFLDEKKEEKQQEKIKPTPKAINTINFIKDATKEITVAKDKIKELEEKISNIKQYNHFYDIENELKYLRKKIEILKEKYKDIKEQLDLDININFDKYELTKSPKKIDETLSLIEQNLKKIEIKKQEMLNKKEEKQQEEEKNQKQKEKKEETKQKKQEVDDIIKAQQLILNNIINQNKYFDQYMKKITKSTNKKRTILSSLSNFANTILNFTVSLLPISLFKNKLLGTLVSSIMINNSIKTMRRMLNPKLNINYQLFIDNYNDSKSILRDTYDMCTNSLEELNELKNELSLYNSNEIEQLLFKIELIENNIKNQMKALNIKKETVEKVYIKIRNNDI